MVMNGHDAMSAHGMAMNGHDAMSAGAFVVAWIAMMAAMMFPAIVPVVRLYARSAAAGRVAPVAVFAGAYLAVWGVTGVPAYVAWRWLSGPVSDGAAWAGRLAGGVVLAAAVYQLTRLKSVCLRHCRSPLAFSIPHAGRPARPVAAARAGARHGLHCLGCCWALMAVLVALGAMQLAWMTGLTLLIVVERNVAHGERVATAAAAVFAVFGVLLLVHPDFLIALT
jgi:predicted metal-binding membrane protein